MQSLYKRASTGSTSSNWRPWPIQLPFLCFFIFLCILLIVGIELVIYGCSYPGCHVFGVASTVQISPATNFVYNLLPTALTVGLSFLWVVPHHDILRLEPYFQMSYPGGAEAEDSLVLEYSYTLPFYLPLIAFKRKHFVVGFSSCILLLMNLVVIPLISGVFEDTALEKHSAGLGSQKQLHGLVDGKYELGAGFTYLAYDYAWHNNTLAPFTTEGFALLPAVNTTQIGESETWITDTTFYYAKLRCDQALTDIQKTPERGVTIGVATANHNFTLSLCDLRVRRKDQAQYNTDSLHHCDLYTTFLTPWTSIAYQISDAAWGRNPTLSRAEQTYLFAWASGANPDWDQDPTTSPRPRKINAAFCTTSYYSQSATANFSMPSGTVGNLQSSGVAQDIIALGTPTPFTGIDNFEKAVNGSFHPPLPKQYKTSDGTVTGLGYAPLQLPNVDAQLIRRFGERPEVVQNLITAVGDLSMPNESNSSIYMNNVYGLSWFVLVNMTKDTLEELLKPAMLIQKYEKALQQWFALAVAIEMVNHDPGAAKTQHIQRLIPVRGFKVNTIWARGAEAGVVAVIVLATLLAVMIVQRACHLDGEPNTLAAALRLLDQSPDLSIAMRDSEFFSPEQIKVMLEQGDRKFQLEIVEGKGPRVLVGGPPLARAVIAPLAGDGAEPFRASQSMQMAGVGVVLLLFFGGVAGMLTGAFAYSSFKDGIPMVATLNSFWYKVIFAYVPAAVSLAVAPILSILASYHCMLGPYQTLMKKNALSQNSLSIDYDKSPPQFQLLRAISKRNLPLAALIIALLLAQVLTVAFSGLFSATSVEWKGTSSNGVIFPSVGFSGPIRGRALEMYYILADNLVRHLPLPPFVTDEYFVVSVDATDDYNEILEYSGPSLGIGIDVHCAVVEPDEVHLACDDSTALSAPYCPGSYYVAVNDTCWTHITRYNNLSTAEELTTTNGDLFIQSAHCASTFFAMWFQRPANPHPSNISSLYLPSLDLVLLKCTTIEKVVALNATITADGILRNINVTRQLSAEEVADMYPAYTNTTDRLPNRFIDTIRAGLLVEDEVNDAHDIRWFDYLTATIAPNIVQNATNITHLPDTTFVVDAFQDVYRRLFAITIALERDLIIYGDAVDGGLPAVFRTTRVFVSGPMYKISAAILLFIMAVLVPLYWGNRGGRFEAHLPRSLGAMYTLLYASTAKGPCGEVEGSNPEERAKELRARDNKYSFGKFNSNNNTDRHVGVYLEMQAPDNNDGLSSGCNS